MTSRALTGVVSITSYTVYDDAVSADDALFNIFVEARLVLLGDDQFTDDTIAMGGQLRNRGDLAIDGGLTLTGASSLVNSGTITQSGGELRIGQADDDTAVVRNIASSTYNLSGGAGVEGAGNSRFVNLGLVQVSDDSVVATDYYDRGELDVAGTLTFTTTVARFFGTIVGAGAVDGDDLMFDGVSLSVANVSAASLRLLGGNTDHGSAWQGSTLTLANASLTLTGDDALVNFMEIRGQGEIDFQGDTTVTAQLRATGGYFLSVAGDVTLNNSGSLTLNGPKTEPTMVAPTLAQVTLSGGSSINNLAGATWTNAAYYITISNAAGDAAAFQNAGTLTENAHVVFNLAFANNGLVDMGPSQRYADTLSYYNPTLQFDDDISGTGTMAISPGQVTVGASIGAGQTLAFATGAPFNYPGLSPTDAAVPTLEIDDPASFAATVAEFDQNGVTDDQIIVNAEGWQYQEFAANAGGTGGSLLFANGSAQASINLAGAYDPAKFHAIVAADETTITYG